MKTKQKNQIRKTTLIVCVLVFCLPMIFAAKETINPEAWFPDDYSVRSGLPLEKIITTPDNSFTQKEVYYWTTRYPFRDTREIGDLSGIEVEIIDCYNDLNVPECKRYFANMYGIIKDNVGFKYSVLKTVPGVGDPRNGKLEIVSALIPQLDAKKTIVADSFPGGDRIEYGIRYEYDKFGNIKKLYDYGVMIGNEPSNERDNFKQGFYDSNPDYMSVYNPYYKTPQEYNFDPLQETRFTSLQGPSPVTVDEHTNWKFDNIITETKYAHEFLSLDSSDPAGAIKFLNWLSLPSEVKVKQEYSGWQLSKTNYQYNTVWSDPGTCGGPRSDTSILCNVDFPACGETTNPPARDLGSKTNYGLNSEYDPSIDTAGPSYCLRSALGGSSTQSAETNIAYVLESYSYDGCGNVISAQISQPFIKPDGTSSTYLRSATIDSYDSYKANPTKITSRASGDESLSAPDITLEATGVSGYGYITKIKDQHGHENSYTYDELGRITSVDVDADGTIESTYTYEEYDSSHFGTKLLRIYETRKISNNREIPSYHFYDSAGRHIQTQTKDAVKGEIIATMTTYDIKGRIHTESKPTTISSENFGQFTPLNSEAITYEYDGIGRVKKIINYDGTEITKDYDITANKQVESITDELLNTRTFYSDSRGNLAGVNLPELTI